ncbi:protocadherin-like wing polarity protein stan isoform X2 [Parasteatoda tepidariorum]|uniref:protocadherin-like wing polarity protein stan isoform X2 n=1 Tax=Parasteatoda tepidariorum TaxID=114398 RepID=UPI001C71C649|nr:protocadherin-like wing polarity protein stan isoform X2 [Parasteatoda tepidariorum]
MAVSDNYLKWTKMLSVLLIIISLSQVLSYDVYVPSENNKLGTVIFNASLGAGRTYRLDITRTPVYVRHLVRVDPRSGVIVLRRTLRCSTAKLANLAPNPFSFYVESRSFRLSGSETESVVMPVRVRFGHRTCPRHKRINLKSFVAENVVFLTVASSQKKMINKFYSPKSNSSDKGNNDIIFYGNDTSEVTACFMRSQLIADIDKIMPFGVLNNCVVQFGQPSDSRYAIEVFGSDLVAREDFCEDSPSWQVSFTFTLSCPSLTHDKTPEVSNHEIKINFHLLGEPSDKTAATAKRAGRHRRDNRRKENKAPYFDRALYVVTVPEEKDKGYVVATMVARDPESDEVVYSLHAVLDARSQNMFSIDSVTGIVTTTASLDREFMDVHYLRVTAVDNGLPQRTGTTTLQINVNDENDHAPAFEQNMYEASIRESASIGSTVVTVRATDQDSGSNAEIEYSILNPSGVNDVFRIDSKTGIITTRGPLDRENTAFYSLIIQASDLGLVVDRKTATTSVEITVLDDNDNYPQFTDKSYTVEVNEDINWLNNPVIAKVKAVDYDSSTNAAVRYSLIGGNTQGRFVIDSLSGEITVVSPLDYESARNYRLVVRAQDGGSPAKSNTTQVLVKVKDINDNDPKFYSSLFQESVVENVPVGHSIVRVQAYDPDDGNNSLISYNIQPSAYSNMPIDINKDTGWIVTTRILDREESSMYDFTVLASDHGSPVRSATASVIVRIQDVNDNDPVFEPKMYGASVSEIDPPGTPVISVTATDKDEDPRLIYQITNGNIRGRFNIISQNRQGLISIAQPLDYRLEKRFVLTVTATDSGGRFDTATVYINITDANTHRPIFEHTPYTGSVAEDSPVGTTVLVVEASDGDVGENSRITYSMDEDVPEFRIDPATGAIVTTRLLNREEMTGYTIVVTAMDNGSPPLADTTNVEIEVSDVNDNPPNFDPSSYVNAVSEDALVGTSVLQIFATDKDLGLNGQIRYTFSGGDNGDGAFRVDPTSGIIRTNRMLDRESVSLYNLVAYGVDRGSPPLSSSVTITIYVEDVNDNPPRFKSDKLKLTIPENSPIGSLVGEVKAYDPDEGPNAEIQYSIVGGPDADSFNLVSRPGEAAELTTRIELDYESSIKKYSVIVRASSPPLRNDVDVEIHVTDVNDNAPVLKDFTIMFNNYKNYFPVGPFGKVPAFDADVTDHLRYKISSGNNANLLILNETTGELKLSPSLNTNVPIHAVMEVSVYDGINEVHAECQLKVRLVSEAMLFNSVTVRLDDMSQTAFLSPLFDYFVEGVAAIVPCPKENIFIFNVQDDTDVEAKILNVSFSVHRPDSRDPDEYYSPHYLQERVYLNRAILARLANVQVLPFDDNLCVREPCVNFEECLSVLKFGNASGFISSDSLLFRPIYPVNTFACRCPQGFTGMKHKYECDTEVNLCFSSPCGPNGTCIRKEGGYTCICRDGFAGKNCEINLWEDRCGEISRSVCHGDSHCMNLGDGGFGCENCSQASWSTRLCELRARSFSRGSFLTFPSLRQRHRLHIRLRFATRQKNALILYNGRYNDKHDFIAMEIIDSQLVVSFSLGSNVSEVSARIPGGLSDGQWHEAELTYLNRTAILSVDGCDTGVAVKYGEELSYKCANSVTHTLEPRCADLMQTCYRFLDLTGPLQIGGLPALPSDFQIKNKDFIGCIMDLYIDHKMVDLNSFVADNGTLIGCPQKKGFCHSQPCLNGGTCEEGWGSFVCHCPPGFGDKDCSANIEPVRHFTGDGFLIFTPHLRPIQTEWPISASFRTRQKDGLLIKAQLGQTSFVQLELSDGFLKYTFNDQSFMLKDVAVNDGIWHNVEAKWMPAGVWLNLDYGQYESVQHLEGHIRGLYVGKVSVGGVQPSEGPENLVFFNGCIQDVRIDMNKDAWLRPSLESNVREGCRTQNPCHANPCPLNSTCIDLWDKYECQCDMGFVGKNCLPVCEVNPCAPGSTCRSSSKFSLHDNHKYGYTCECDGLHTGEYCEVPLDHPCPSNWWGYPICGPCHCDTNKGYDANCNKTNGACTCEDKHFQPLHSDICFDCDCYATGSFGNRCDPITGQCKCRAGVIGRRCDSCSNPFAEVTLRGCEVVYDGCPQSFSMGIWWDRTLFDQEASHPCPKGAVGKATRYCAPDTGWEDPDLFKCTSETFLELADQLAVIERDKLPLSTYFAVKISSDLRKATNSTKSLYGSDILIVDRMLNHVLNYETEQGGLNLTHRQDKDFIQGLVESASKILEPRYTSMWERIATFTDAGPENLIRMFEDYAKTLIQNQEDTFTEPFEVAAKNMVFGLDTISASELWSLPSDGFTSNNLSLSPETSQYMDISDFEIGPAVLIPKYNNFPRRKSFLDDVTKAKIPLKILNVKSIEEKKPNKQRVMLLSRDSAVIAYAIYPTAGQMLPPGYDLSIRQRFGITLSANTPMMSIVIQPANSTEIIKQELSSDINFQFRIHDTSDHSSPQCVFWDYTIGPRGKWSSEGCTTLGMNLISGRGMQPYVNCSCSHLSTFGVLMDITDKEYFMEESTAQDVVSYLGIVISLLMLLAAFLIFCLLRGPQTNSNNIHKNLVACIFLAQLLFLIALKLRRPLVQREFPCKVMAIMLHYMFLCVFSWMFLEAVHLYRMLTEMRDINHGQMRFYYSIGYGAPAIVVGLSVGVRADQYGNYFFCWLSIYESVVWSLVGPICFVVLLNLGVFAMAIRASVQIKDTVMDFGNLRTVLWLGIVLLPLLGATWVLAILSVNESLEVLHYIFSIFSCVTGIYIFVGYCIINKKVRQQLHHTWARMRGKKVPYDESLSGTRTTVVSRSALAYQNSSFDVLQRNMGISTSSTTSRSTTKTSSSPYRSDSHLKNTSTSTSVAGSEPRRRSSRKGYLYGRHRHKHRVADDPDTGEINRRRAKDSDSESDLSLDHASLDLASSHSSDEDEYSRDTWKKKSSKTPPEVPPKPNITIETNIYGTNIVPTKGFNLPPLTPGSIGSNISPYSQYTSSWGLPRNIIPSTPVGPSEGIGLTVGLPTRDPIVPWGRGNTNREKGGIVPQRLQDISSYLDPNFTPELLDEVSSPEQLPVPERCDSLHSSVNNVNKDLNIPTTPSAGGDQDSEKETNTNVASAVEGKKVVLPQLTTAEVSSESEESNETSV